MQQRSYFPEGDWFLPAVGRLPCSSQKVLLPARNPGWGGGTTRVAGQEAAEVVVREPQAGGPAGETGAPEREASTT
jgi:hypothetical protein